MAGNCDICGEKLGFRKFHCQDGVVCKKCYAVVSNGFTETITKKTLAELKKTYKTNAVPIDLGEDGFVVTRKIQSLLLIDEQNKKFCISGNPTVSKEYSRPEIYHYEDLMGYMLICEPELTPEELVHLKEDKKTVNRARKVQRYLSQSFSVAEHFTGMAGTYVPLKETLRGFRMILDGACDEIPESCFLFAGNIDEVFEKAKVQNQ